MLRESIEKGGRTSNPTPVRGANMNARKSREGGYVETHRGKVHVLRGLARGRCA